MIASKMSHFFYTIHRTLLSLIFLVAGSGHIFNTDSIVKRMSILPMSPYLEMIAPLSVFAAISGVVLILGGLGLLLGLKTRWSAMLLIAVLIPITLTVQLQGGHTTGPLFKNIGLLGGLLYFAYFGAQGWSIDKNIKKLGVVTFFFVFFQVIAPGPAAAATTVVDKIVILVKNERHLKMAIKTLSEGRNGVEELKIKDSSIIVCGKDAIPALKKNTLIKDSIKLAEDNRIKLIACGISVKQAGIEPKDILHVIRIVPNGLRELIKLKANGYMTIEL